MPQKPVAVVKSQSRRSVGNARRSGQFTPQVLTVPVPGDVESLSDMELRAELEDYGIDVGPITVTSRSVYRRKLADCRRGRTQPERPLARGWTVTSFSDEEVEEDEEESADYPDYGQEDMEDGASCEDEDTDHGAILTTRTWPRVSALQHSVPTVAQAGSTPPRASPGSSFLRQRQQSSSATGHSDWSQISRQKPSVRPTSTTTTDGGTSPGRRFQRNIGSPRPHLASSEKPINVTDDDHVNRRDLLRRQIAPRHSGTDFARFLELLAVGLFGFFLVIVLAYVEGPHQRLVPSRPFFPSDK